MHVCPPRDSASQIWLPARGARDNQIWKAWHRSTLFHFWNLHSRPLGDASTCPMSSQIGSSFAFLMSTPYFTSCQKVHRDHHTKSRNGIIRWSNGDYTTKSSDSHFYQDLKCSTVKKVLKVYTNLLGALLFARVNIFARFVTSKLRFSLGFGFVNWYSRRDHGTAATFHFIS